MSMVGKLYKILKAGEIIGSEIPGTLAGYAPDMIFGRLDCRAGVRMKKENRVFFHTLEDAITEGYRPCKSCKPIDENDFKRIRHSVPYERLSEFYHRDDWAQPKGCALWAVPRHKL